MGVVIVGGNECMVCQYEKICKGLLVNAFDRGDSL